MIAPKVGGAKGSDGRTIKADFQLAGGPSVLFDTVVLGTVEGWCTAMLTKEAAAVAFVHDAFAHLKVIGHTDGAQALMDKAGVVPDAGVVALGKPGSLSQSRQQRPYLGARAERANRVLADRSMGGGHFGPLLITDTSSCRRISAPRACRCSPGSRSRTAYGPRARPACPPARPPSSARRVRRRDRDTAPRPR